MKSEYFISLPNDICCSLQTFAAIARGHLNWPYLRNTIGFRRDFPSTAEDLGARNNLNRQTNMATVSKSPLPPMPPRPQSVPLLRKTMSPEPSNVKASPIRSKTPLVRKRSRCQRDFSSQRFHFNTAVHNRLQRASFNIPTVFCSQWTYHKCDHSKKKAVDQLIF